MPESMDQVQQLSELPAITLEGNRIINIPLAGQWINENTVCAKCKIGNVYFILLKKIGSPRITKETKHGFASTLFWMCDTCRNSSILKTSPQHQHQYEINSRMVTALKTSSTGGSYKVCESLAANLDMPSLTRNAFFAKSKSIGEVIQRVSQRNAESALQGKTVFSKFIFQRRLSYLNKMEAG